MNNIIRSITAHWEEASSFQRFFILYISVITMICAFIAIEMAYQTAEYYLQADNLRIFTNEVEPSDWPEEITEYISRHAELDFRVHSCQISQDSVNGHYVMSTAFYPYDFVGGNRTNAYSGRYEYYVGYENSEYIFNSLRGGSTFEDFECYLVVYPSRRDGNHDNLIALFYIGGSPVNFQNAAAIGYVRK